MRYYLLFLVLILSIPSSAQTKVSGTVYDQDKQPVAFANVLFKGSSEGVISDIDGRFTLQSENNHSSIVVSFVGFETTELKLKNQNELINVNTPEDLIKVHNVINKIPLL